MQSHQWSSNPCLCEFWGGHARLDIASASAVWRRRRVAMAAMAVAGGNAVHQRGDLVLHLVKGQVEVILSFGEDGLHLQR